MNCNCEAQSSHYSPVLRPHSSSSFIEKGRTRQKTKHTDFSTFIYTKLFTSASRKINKILSEVGKFFPKLRK